MLTTSSHLANVRVHPQCSARVEVATKAEGLKHAFTVRHVSLRRAYAMLVLCARGTHLRYRAHQEAQFKLAVISHNQRVAGLADESTADSIAILL